MIYIQILENEKCNKCSLNPRSATQSTAVPDVLDAAYQHLQA